MAVPVDGNWKQAAESAELLRTPGRHVAVIDGEPCSQKRLNSIGGLFEPSCSCRR